MKRAGTGETEYLLQDEELSQSFLENGTMSFGLRTPEAPKHSLILSC